MVVCWRLLLLKINKVYKHDEFSIAAVPLLKDIPESFQVFKNFTWNSDQVLAQYEFNSPVLSEVISVLSFNEKIFVAQQAITLMSLLPDDFSVNLSKDNITVSSNLEIKFICVDIYSLTTNIEYKNFNRITGFVLSLFIDDFSIDGWIGGVSIIEPPKFLSVIANSSDIFELKKNLLEILLKNNFQIYSKKRIKKYGRKLKKIL
jgi:hypothetical protein